MRLRLAELIAALSLATDLGLTWGGEGDRDRRYQQAVRLGEFSAGIER